MTRINIMALRHSAFYSPLLMTMAGNFLLDEGLEAEYSLATPDKTVPDSLRDGSCHVAQSAVATSFADLEQGKPVDIVHFAQINSRDGFFLAAREPDETFTWDKLIGKKVLVDHFFQPLAMFKYALKNQGISFDDLEAIDAGSVEEIDRAFREGYGDYVHQQGPAPQQMQHDGVAHVVASIGKAIGPVAFSSLSAMREWCDSDMARAFIRAYKKSLDYVIDAPAMDIARKEVEAGFFPDIDINVLAKTIQAYKELGCWESDPVISMESYENLLEVFLYNRLISQRYTYDQVIVKTLSE